VIHLKAIAGRIGVPLELEDWTTIGRGTPTIVDLLPSGRFLMEEFYYAGGLPGAIRRLGEGGLLPHKDALTVNGKTPVGKLPGCADLRRRSDPSAGQAADRRRRHLHPARQPGAARRRAEAIGRHART
jgi:dihydroxyacid dehydratase/phosphogluconate dehydratase